MKFIKKAWNYYRKNGLIACFKTLYRKLFKKIDNNGNKGIKNFVLSVNESEKNESVLKDGRVKSIFIFATVPYYDVGGGQRSSQISKIFNSMGYSVYYIYAFDSSESKIFDISMPLVLHKNIDNFTNYEFFEYIKKDDICIFEAPCKKFDEYLETAFEKKAKVVYENIDNWETSLGSMVYNEKTLINMLKLSDMITATAGLLVEQTKKYFEKYNLPKKEVIYLPNAVDDELFEPLKKYEMPNDLKKGEKTLIYYGSLWGEWFDWELIDKVARSNEKITINLIGDYSPIVEKIKKLPSNVHFLGLKKQTDLPAYLVYSDYAILPFKRCDIGNYVSPLKIFEYISMNKNVLATNLPDIIGYPNVYNFDSADEWNDIISKDTVNVDVEKRNEFIQENNWYNRCSNIINILFPENKLKVNNKFYDNISIIVLNHNNKNVIFRCIDTLLKFNSRYKYEVIVVDNNSTDGSYEALKNKYIKKEIKILRNEKNGCASGRNIGVDAAKNDYILFLDSDQWALHDYWLDIYLDILDKNKFIGAVAWSAGWFNKKGYAYKYVAWYEHKYLQPNMLYRKDIGYLATCGFIMKKSTFKQVGGFDTFYDPTCYEDTDLSVSIRNIGLETVYSTYLGVGHIPHQTTKSGSESHSKLLMQKGEYFKNKWFKINKKLLSNYIKD